MNVSVKMLANIVITATIMVLSGCSTQEVKQETTAPTSEDAAALSLSNKEPPLTILKGDQTLNLFRVMDGAICKNDQEGAKGEFLLYVNPKDIDRIKQKEDVKVFGEFEQKIETFSGSAFENAINATDLTKEPFALGDYEAQRKLAKQVTAAFATEISPNIDKFIAETTLTINVVAFPSSFVFYHKGCDISKMNLPE